MRPTQRDSGIPQGRIESTSLRSLPLREAAQTDEQIGKFELLTALLTDCLLPNNQNPQLFNYFRMVGEAGLEPAKP